MAWTKKKIYELSAHSSIVDTDVMPISATASGNAEKSTAAEVKAYVKTWLTTADVAASTNKNYVTDAQATVIGNTSWTNTGDETASTIKSKLWITTLSWDNTGDQNLSWLMVKSNNLSDVSNTVTARNNILPSKTGNSLKVLRVNSWETDYELATAGAWTWDVTWPWSSTANHIPQFSDTTGKVLKDWLWVVTTLGSPWVDTNIPTEKAVRAAIAWAWGWDVSWPSSATDLNVAVFDWATWKLIKDGWANLASKVTANWAITWATKTKITYDAKWLVTWWVDATTADIADSTDKRYVSDAQLVVIWNTSWTNSWDNAANTTANTYADWKVSDTAYDATTWDWVTTIAPSKNAIRDKIETLAPLASPTFTWTVTLPKVQLWEESIELDPALSADGTWSWISEVWTLWATIAFWELVYFQASDSRWELVDANVSAWYDKKLGICLVGWNDWSSTRILLFGKIRADAKFPTMTIWSPVYMWETAGTVVVTQPTTADACIRVVWYANTADELFFNPSNDYITHS
jgi:hypothetical protein